MTYEELVELRRRLDGAHILSAYLPGAAQDPALRAESQTLLEAGLSRIRHTLTDATRVERETFLAASEHVVRALGIDARPRNGTGIAVFAAADGVRHLGPLLAPAPTVVEWRDGVVVSPYLASLSRKREVVLAVIDSRAAKIVSCRNGTVEPLESFAAEIREEPPLHMGDSARVPWHSGVHGVTGTDETQRRELAAFERMLNQLLQRLTAVSGSDALVVVGGMPESVHRLTADLPKALADRYEAVSGLTTLSSESDMLAAVNAAADALNRRRERRLVVSLLDRGHAGGRASLGYFRTHLALEERAASTLLLSRRFVERRLGRAEKLVRLAMDGGARAEVIGGEAGQRLDDESEGVAAELRYALPFSTFAGAGLQDSAD
jgi:hypothetical protein